MRRRDVLAAIVGGQAASTLLAYAPQRDERQQAFESEWHQRSDMIWTGPDSWAQPMQDWAVIGGELTCLNAAPGRTLHVLTHQGTGRHQPMHARLGLRWHTGVQGRAGLRIGIRGRFDDHRSAVMTGKGIDCALTSEGALVIDGARSRLTLSSAQRALSLTLELTIRPAVGDRSLVSLLARGPDGQVFASVEAELADAALRGNVAVLSDFTAAHPPSAGPAVSFAGLALWGERLDVDYERRFGPIYFAQYTVHDATLRISAQLAPLDLADLEVRLQIRIKGRWREVARAWPDATARVASFTVEDWQTEHETAYRLTLRASRHEPWQPGYVGTIAAEPIAKPTVRALTASCNWDYGFPDTDVVRHASQHGADLILFLGDQYYEENGGFGIQEHPPEAAVLDYLRKWIQFGWSYRELFRHRPAIFLVDDHDVFQGNLWGAGGKAAPTQGSPAERSDGGGYRMPPEWVNAVQRTQTSHMPPPYNPQPAQQGISTYFCDWRYAGISFAIIEDRKFKSAPRSVLPTDAKVVNGYVLNPRRDHDIRDDAAEATLLGERQLAFLRQWSTRSDDTAFRVLVSATPFACPHTLPSGARGDEGTWELGVPVAGEYVDGDAPTPDLDSNGWPRAGRDEVLRLLRGKISIHLTGDQHLAQVVRYGVDAHGDGFPAFIAPALCNYWPRRWWPPRDGHRPLAGKPDYTGDWIDAIGNRLTVYAAANPTVSGIEPALIHDLAPGYGVVDFERATKRIIVHCWPRHADPSRGPQGQYPGWPVYLTAEHD